MINKYKTILLVLGTFIGIPSCIAMQNRHHSAKADLEKALELVDYALAIRKNNHHDHEINALILALEKTAATLLSKINRVQVIRLALKLQEHTFSANVDVKKSLINMIKSTNTQPRPKNDYPSFR